MKNIKSLILNTFFISFFPFVLFAAQVDTVSFESNAIQKETKAVVITPEGYEGSAKRFPVLYLLHGYSDSYDGWIKKVPSVKEWADFHQMIVVCPDGGYFSWYLDSPLMKKMQYETLFMDELLPFIDKNYRTKAQREARAITGLSMGGHGALYLAFRHQNLFGAAGSMSGGLDIRPFPKNWQIPQLLGSFAENPKNWEKHTVINQVHLLTNDALDIFIDCGTEDFFYEVNEAMHKKLLARNIPHDYITRPGKHNWEYWDNALPYQMLFFSNFFDKLKE